MNYIKICLAAACILRLCSPLSVALAGSVTQPGSTLGTAPGAACTQDEKWRKIVRKNAAK